MTAARNNGDCGAKPRQRRNGSNGDCEEQPRRAARQKRAQSNGDCEEQPKRAARQKRAQSNEENGRPVRQKRIANGNGNGCEENGRPVRQRRIANGNGNGCEENGRSVRQRRIANGDEDEENGRPVRQRRIANGNGNGNGCEENGRPVRQRRIANGDEDEENHKPARQKRIKDIDNGECGARVRQQRVAKSPPRLVRRAPPRRQREIEEESEPDCDNPRPNIMKSVIKQGTFSILYFTLALVDDLAVHGAFEKNTQWFVVVKNFITALTYQMSMQKQPSFVHLLASASIFSWLTVALFEPTFNLDFEGIKNVLVQHATNVGLLYEKFVLFRMLETVSSW